MEKRAIAGALLLALALTGAGNSPHDKVELLSGEVLFGRVLRYNREEVSIQLGSGGILSFRMSQVRKVRARRLPDPFAEEDPESGDDSFIPEDLILRLSRSDEPPRSRPEPGPEASDASRAPTVEPRSLPILLEPLRPAARESEPVAEGTTLIRPEPSGREATTSLSRRVEPRSGRVSSTSPSPPAPPSLAPKPGASERENERVTIASHGFSIIPPSGFVAVGEVDGQEIVAAWEDPITHATLQITAYATETALADVREDVKRSLAGRFDAFRLERDVPLGVESDSRWLLEVQGRLGPISLRQVQVLARRGTDLLIITYSTEAASWDRHGASFLESARSFELTSPDAARG